MRRIISLFIVIFLFFSFSACSTKSESDIVDSGNKDVSELLKTLIQKEKEINELNRQLEECKKAKAKKCEK